MKVTYKEVREFKFRINPEERQGAYGLYFMRPMSTLLTFMAIRLGISANQVTVGQILAGLLGSAFLISGEADFMILGLALLQFGFLLDNVDGEVARFSGTVSLTGKYLDTVGHELVVPSLYFCLGLGNFLLLGNIESVIFGFLAGLFSLRLDVLTMSHEALQFAESNYDATYDYYDQFKGGAVPSLYRQKNEHSLTRIIYGMFAYPAIMNIICALVLLDLFLPIAELTARGINSIYIFLVLYGALIPLRRAYTISRFVKARSTEQKFLSLRK